MQKILKNNPWSRLRSVVLGRYYEPDYFSQIDNSKIQSTLMRLADEINQDLDHFQQELEKHDCLVLRPDLIPSDEFANHIQTHGVLPRPPLHVRNEHFVAYDKIFKTGNKSRELDVLLGTQAQVIDISQDIAERFHQSCQMHQNCHDHNRNVWFRKQKYQELAGPDWPEFYDYVNGARSNDIWIATEMRYFESALEYETRDFTKLSAPCVITMPDRLVVDSNEYCVYDDILQSQFQTDVMISRINTGAGHTDGCFTVLGNNTIIGIDDVIKYQDHFSGFHVIAIPASHYGDIVAHKKVNNASPKWWIDGVLPDGEVARFIDKYMADYTGNVYETLFDVNVLCMDDRLVFISNDNTDIRRQLSKRGIDSVVVPWRHRFFVDGGLHCITLDLYRDPVVDFFQ